nr:MAG TPA: hypothetical protein [Bacteriophage sp.]
MKDWFSYGERISYSLFNISYGIMLFNTIKSFSKYSGDRRHSVFNRLNS